MNSLVGLPRRAREWRTARRDRSGQAALREALAQYFGGRYTRAQKAAQRALAIQAETPELAQDNEFTVLAHLLAAGSAHRVQNRAVRDEELRRALELSQRSPAAQLGRGGRAPARRRMGARRPRCRTRRRAAQRAAARRRPSHPRVAPEAAGGAARPSAAGGAEDGAHCWSSIRASRPLPPPGCCARSRSSRSTPSHDADQLRRLWLSFDGADRRDPFIAARAATRASALGAHEDARTWLRPLWERIDELARRGAHCARGGARRAPCRDRRRMAGAARVRARRLAARRRRRSRRRTRARRARSLGQGARVPRAGRRRRDAAGGGATQGLDRARRARRPGRRLPPVPHAATRAPRARRDDARCYNSGFSGCSSVG